ncbi:hypothetical protein MTR72_31945 [Bradyrhizobium sp. ISRA442]|uniref:hypothetical protein n=1 Tax=Bradyrhizobium sp. ISRA442 TaxID=2866197 RepID=UPI00311AD2BB
MISRQGSQLKRLREAVALVISFRQFGQCGCISQSKKVRCRMLRAAFTGPADGPKTTNALKPSHNATPVHTRVVVMMCSRQTGKTHLK